MPSAQSKEFHFEKFGSIYKHCNIYTYIFKREELDKKIDKVKVFKVESNIITLYFYYIYY